MSDVFKSIDALYSDRIRLLQVDPERYFQLYPRPKFGFQLTGSDSCNEKE
ncbi:hypothetical protein CMUST_00695 [Corynebacterium mustelae]|uniref:Uncharacterized protein n=1 Tax=Corynebacterium mustelae TaxID=571915 RepID=A0A0G3GY72_9CORY|nr:hypothetical protein CMUST_00695 [Corynebacterium mustelae]